MPNWCENRVTITGPKEKIDACERIKADFERMFPTPKELLKLGAPITDSKIEELNISKYGFADWYQWRIANWGTKWPIPDKDVTVERISDTELVLEYSTAWAPAFEFLRKQSELLHVMIEASFFEPGCDFTGTNTYENGEVIEEDCHSVTKYDREAWGYDEEEVE